MKAKDIKKQGRKAKLRFKKKTIGEILSMLIDLKTTPQVSRYPKKPIKVSDDLPDPYSTVIVTRGSWEFSAWMSYNDDLIPFWNFLDSTDRVTEVERNDYWKYV